MSFNGTSGSYVDLGDVYNGVNFPITFEAWVYPTSTPNYNPIFASDNSTGNYSGFTVRLDNGYIFFSMGDGTGVGAANRIGVYSSSSIPTNRWTHIACVASNANSWFIYINGVQDVTIPTGTSQATSLVWSNSPAYIGRYNDAYQNSYWAGQIDEVRFWNSARTQNEIRNFMCRKLVSASTGLIGYWTVDESYSSSTILDHTFPAEDGYIVGNVEKTTSGAPLGDKSHYMYTNDWTGKLLSLTAATGDKIGAKNITGNPHGVQMYLVNSEPYYTDSLNITPNYYFGVFCAESATAASYKVGYKYKYQNGIITAENEGLADVYTRMDGSVSEWHDLNANHDLSSNEFKKDNQISRGEYILNVEDGLKSAETSLFTSKGSINMISIFPNPAVNHITVDLSQVYEPIHSIRIIDLTGKIYYENKFIKNTKEFTADISTFSAGHYVVELITGSGRISGKFEVVR